MVDFEPKPYPLQVAHRGLIPPLRDDDGARLIGRLEAMRTVLDRNVPKRDVLAHRQRQKWVVRIVGTENQPNIIAAATKDAVE